MPIQKNAVVRYTFMRMDVDMSGPFISAQFNMSVDGEAVGSRSVSITGNDLLALIGVPGEPGKPRGADITDAIYAYAISSGQLVGEIS